MRRESCPLCDAVGGREIFRFLRPRAVQATGRHTEDLFGRAGTLVRCDRCGLVRQADAPEVLYEEAEDPIYLAEEAGIRLTFGRILERIERYRTAGTLLDVGCGPGLLLEEARARGWRPVGIEPSAWGVAKARARGFEVLAGTLEGSRLSKESFDAIVAADVIEHVQDPSAFVRQIRRLLVPGGVAFIATPNIESLVARVLRRWWWSIIPNHLWFLSPRTLSVLLTDAGLRVLETSTHPKTFSVGYYAARFGGYNRTLGSLTSAIGRVLGGSGRLITPDFRDRAAVIAQRRGRARAK